jgi:hypothetical protein
MSEEKDQIMKRIVAFAAVLFSTSLLLAGPVDQKQISADAKWAVHADVEALLASDTGKFVLAEIEKQPQAQAGLKVFATTFGIDLTKDIKGITLYGADFSDKTGVAIINCKFDKDKLTTILKTNPTYKESKLGERTVHQWQDQAPAGKAADKDKAPAEEATAKPTKYGVFFADDLAVITQDRDVLAVALDVLDGKKDNLTKGALAKALTAPKGAFLTGALCDLAQAAKGKPEPQAALFKKMDSATLVAGEDAGKVFAHLSVTAVDAQTATDLRKMADGFLAFLDLAKDMQNEAGQHAIPASLSAIIKDVKVASDGATVNADLSTDSKNVVEFLNMMLNAHAAPAKAVEEMPAK